jgi:hypothetical protein
VPGNSPSVEENQPAKTGDGVKSSDPTPFPVVIVESPEQADHASKRESNSDDHETADLQAQRDAADGAQRAAASAERQEIPAWVQILLAVLGTIIATVAVVSSITTALRQDNTARKQLRAYLTVENISAEPDAENFPIGKVTLKNTGQTPAKKVRFKLGFPNNGAEPHELLMIENTMTASVRDVGSGGEYVISQRWNTFHGPYRDSILSGEQTGWLHGVVEYRDVYDEIRYTWFKFGIGRNHNIAPDADGNVALFIYITPDLNEST